MTHICIVRHGETDWNLRQLVQGKTDIPLNEHGRRQAGETAEYLGKTSWDALYSSPLNRARESARIIGKEIGFSDIQIDARLEERDFGEAEGIYVEQRREFYKDKIIPGAESWEEVRRRGVEVVEELQNRHRDERIIAVAHGGLISSILFHFSNGEIQPGDPPLKNSCMNLLSWDGSWHIEWYNRTAAEALEASETAGRI